MSTLLDTETIILDALDFTVACAMSDAGCDHTATVAASCRRCGLMALFCDQHLAVYRRWFARQRDMNCVVACKGCKVHMTSFDAGISVVDL